MRTGESGSGTLAYLLRTFHQVIEETMLITRTGQQFLVMIEVIADGREDTLRHVIIAYGGEVELRTRHRHEDR